MKGTDRGPTEVLGKRAIPAVAALIVLTFALMAALLLIIARGQDRHAAEQAASFAQRAIDRRLEVTKKEIKDYAAWGEAYQHLHVRNDTTWAYAQQNLGATLFKDFGYDDVLVVGPAGTVTYAVVDGELASSGQVGLLGGGLDALVKAARSASTGEASPVVGFIVAEGVPLLVAASVITTGGDPTIVQTLGPPSVLVFADALTPDRLLEIGNQSFLDRLRTPSDERDRHAGPSLAVKTADQASEITFRWDPEKPGMQLLNLVLPWLILAGMAFALLTVLVLRRTMRIALQIESNATALAEAHRLVEHSALHDGVTLLPNRVMLNRFLQRELSHGDRGPAVAVVYVDLDRFKPINDSFGHDAGDGVLQETARRLRAVVRECDIVARVGGDEFVVALSGIHSDDQVERMCDRLLDIVRAPIVVQGAILQIGISMGIAIAPRDGPRIEDLLRQADLAMYRAKKEGGNRYRFFSLKETDAQSSAA